MKQVGNFNIEIGTESREITIPSRPQPLSIEDYKKLESLFSERVEVRENTRAVSIPLKDANGEVYGWETGVVTSGYSLNLHAPLEKSLTVALIRPCTRKHIVAHLTRLATHVHYPGSEGTFAIMLEDLAHDLEGLSEWAIVKACEHFRSCGTNFWPKTHEIITKVKEMHDLANQAYAHDTPGETPQAREAPSAPENTERDGKRWKDMSAEERKAFMSKLEAIKQKKSVEDTIGRQTTA